MKVLLLFMVMLLPLHGEDGHHSETPREVKVVVTNETPFNFVYKNGKVLKVVLVSVDKKIVNDPQDRLIETATFKVSQHGGETETLSVTATYAVKYDRDNDITSYVEIGNPSYLRIKGVVLSWTIRDDESVYIGIPFDDKSNRLLRESLDKIESND